MLSWRVMLFIRVVDRSVYCETMRELIEGMKAESTVVRNRHHMYKYLEGLHLRR
jgi:hypothetical protein